MKIQLLCARALRVSRVLSAKGLLLFWVFIALSHVTSAAVTMPSIFGDGMVLQRDQELTFWGWAIPGEKVAVSFHEQQARTTADSAGRWRLQLPAISAHSTGGQLVIRGENELVFNDVLVGEVWLASGQSNMAFPLSGTSGVKDDVPAARDPGLRLFTVERRTNAEPQQDLGGRWLQCEPASAADFSGVAYFFGRKLRRQLGVPVGLIVPAWGGTPARSWMSLKALRENQALGPELELWTKAITQHEQLHAEKTTLEDYRRAAEAWRRDVRPLFVEQKKAFAAAAAAGQSSGSPPVPARPEPINPDPTETPGDSVKPITPCVVFNAMVAPMAGFPIRGVLWYQGERDAPERLRYRQLLSALIVDWRREWNAPRMPFLLVQLPGYENAPGSPAERQLWPWVREAQSQVLSEPATGMAVSYDVGDPHDVHPRNKEVVGERLARVASALVYRAAVVATGPRFSGSTIEGERVRLRFEDEGGGLVIGQSPWTAPSVTPLPRDRLVGFAVAGRDRRWFSAEAYIDGTSVVVRSDSVPQPTAVRYGWADFPRANLYNREGLPAAPFRTDDWPPAISASP